MCVLVRFIHRHCSATGRGDSERVTQDGEPVELGAIVPDGARPVVRAPGHGSTDWPRSSIVPRRIGSASLRWCASSVRKDHMAVSTTGAGLTIFLTGEVNAQQVAQIRSAVPAA